MHLSIVIPAYNEEKRITPTLDSVSAFVNNTDFLAEVLVIDDGSTDGTAALIQDRKESGEPFRLISYQSNQGKGYAVRKGMLAANGKYRLFMDADSSMPIDQAPGLLEVLEQENAQVAIASRYIAGSRNLGQGSAIRRFVSRLGGAFIRLTVLPGIADSQCGFKLFTSEAAAALFTNLQVHRWGFDVEVLARARALGMKIVEVPVKWQPMPGTTLSAWRATPSVLMTTVQVAWRYHTGQYCTPTEDK